jgi:hypothetical protein
MLDLFAEALELLAITFDNGWFAAKLARIVKMQLKTHVLQEVAPCPKREQRTFSPDF